jgi:SpoIID/LytB domain protein
MRVWVAVFVAALVIPSVARGATVFVLQGGGWGHGVGMSQWGAEGYALHGYDYQRILAHYYPHTQLTVLPSREVRVLLKERLAEVRISSAAPYVVVDARGRTVHLDHAVTVTGRFSVGGRALTPPLRFEPGVQPVSVGGDGYRGDLVVEPAAGGLTVVNDVSLERYLRGVVPSEEPSRWDAAAYEAQAVAARTYALASLRPDAPFDLYPDQRSQMYGGIRAERPWTNLAVGATAGKVLTYDGRVITAYYFSTSGGRTSAVQDAFPWLAPEPYLVSVPDPYDSISPKHTWKPRALSASFLATRLGLDGVTGVVEHVNGSYYAGTLDFDTATGWTAMTGSAVEQKLRLPSTNFRLGAMSLDPAPKGFDSPRVVVRGVVEGLAHVQLERLDGGNWTTVTYVHPHRQHFALALRAKTPLALRLVAAGVPTPPVTFR